MAPPIFNKFGSDHELLKKSHSPSSKRGGSLHGSLPIIKFHDFQSKQADKRNSTPTASETKSDAKTDAPKSPKPLSKPVSKPKSTSPETKRDAKTEELKVSEPPAKPVVQSYLSDEGSYVEEIIGDDESYEEEVIDDEEYEEIIEEIYIEPPELPERAITIKFHEFDDMQTTLHINDYTSGELEKSWYGRTDYDKMVKKARSTVAKVEAKEEASKKKALKKSKGKGKDSGKRKSKSSPDGDDHSDDEKNDEKEKKVLDTRGLEGWSTSGSLFVRELKEKAVEAVWNEQSRQWTTGDRDAEKLRAAYLPISTAAQAIAESRAAEDAAAAVKIRAEEKWGKAKKDLRGLLINKSIFAKPKKSGLIGKAKKKVKKVVSNKKKDEKETDKPTMYRQPSQVSRLVLLDDLDGKLRS